MPRPHFMSFYSIQLFQMAKKTNLVKLARRLDTRANQVAYLREKGVLPTTASCQRCGELVSKTEICQQKADFRCSACKAKTSLRKGTILFNSKLSLR